MTLQFETKNKLANNDDLLQFEQQIGADLPADYRQFLLSINGGRPKDQDELTLQITWGDKSWADETEEIGLDYMYSLGVQNPAFPGLDLEYNYKTFSLSQRIPKGTIPIANDQGGSQYLIDVNKDHYGHIYYWYMPFEKSDDTEPDYGNVASVADSFT